LTLYAVFKPDEVGLPVAVFGAVDFDERDDLRVHPIFRAGIRADGVDAWFVVFVQNYAAEFLASVCEYKSVCSHGVVFG
jgi:hypothetical protein